MSEANATTQAEAVPVFSRIESRDFDRIALAMKGMDVDARQVSRGAFRGQVELVALGPFHVIRTVANRTLQARGAVRAGTACVSLITATNEGSSWRHSSRKRGELNVNSPSSEIDHLTCPDYDSLSVVADLDRVRAAGDALLGIDAGPCLLKPGGVAALPRSFAALEGAVRSVLDLGRSRAGFLESPRGRAVIEESLTRSFVNALAGERLLAEDGPAPNRRRVADRAEEFMLANLRSTLPMARVCEELDVSERTLRYAFRDRFGMSPLAYFKTLRLNAIRRQIGTTNAAAGRVQEIARQWGVVHLGNFAADYRRLFGEAPSETARQARGAG